MSRVDQGSAILIQQSRPTQPSVGAADFSGAAVTEELFVLGTSSALGGVLGYFVAGIFGAVGGALLAPVGVYAWQMQRQTEQRAAEQRAVLLKRTMNQ